MQYTMCNRHASVLTKKKKLCSTGRVTDMLLFLQRFKNYADTPSSTGGVTDNSLKTM